MRNPMEHMPLSTIIDRLGHHRLTAEEAMSIRNNIEDLGELDALEEDWDRVIELARMEEFEGFSHGTGDLASMNSTELLSHYDNDLTSEDYARACMRLVSLGYEFLQEVDDNDDLVYAALSETDADWELTEAKANADAELN